MTDIKCPCRECLCVGICRHKEYIKLFSDCILVRKWYGRASSITQEDKFAFQLYTILQPTTWGA
jgi:hypothetical protein